MLSVESNSVNEIFNCKSIENVLNCNSITDNSKIKKGKNKAFVKQKRWNLKRKLMK